VITHTGASVSPAGARNFSGPVSYTVTAADGSTAGYTVIVSLEPLDTTGGVATDVAAYLAKAALVYGGSTDAEPIPLPVDITLSTGWTALLTAIDTGGKYVALDLSACAMTGEFNPDNTNGTDKGKIASLVLPDGATSVKAGTSINPTFKYFTALKSVAGAGITSVGEWAFRDCDALSSVNIPAAASIGGYAFYHCDALTTVNLPAATSIGVGAFFTCTALSSVNIPAATSIGNSAFQSCTALSSVNIPASVTSIGDGSFAGCTSLTSITVAAGNTKYRHSDDGRMLLSKDGKTLLCYPAASGTVTLNGIETVGIFAFYNCTALNSVNIPAATSIGNGAFRLCAALSSVNIPAATSIGDDAFRLCAALSSVNLPAATSIGETAFSLCTALSSVNLPAATSIGDDAFIRCDALSSISLPKAASIGERAFALTGGRALTVTLGAAPPSVRVNMFYDVTNAKAVTVKVPSSALSVYGSSISGADTGTQSWANAFRGMGWDGTDYLAGTVKTNITVTIQAQ
jgi:hypothetical protein